VRIIVGVVMRLAVLGKDTKKALAKAAKRTEKEKIKKRPRGKGSPVDFLQGGKEFEWK